MDSQSNQQNQQNQQNNQQEQNTDTNQPQQPGLSGLFFPINFIFREGTGHDNPQRNGSQEQQPQAQREQTSQFIHFFTYPMPGAQGDNATQGLFFFTPFNMPQQEIRKPRASESAMKMLPIVTITKEHVDKQMSCPICLELFSLYVGREKNETEIDQHEIVRQMPCEHMFCESCLFQWLRQNNSCPLCRKEIKAEESEAQQQEDNNEARPHVPSIPLFGVINIAVPSSPSPSSNEATINTNSQPHNHTSHSTSRTTISCALASVGCCEEIDSDTSTTIITLPQCHHRFHASCLRTSLLVEGYPSGDFNSISHQLNFRCPTCRAPAIVQSDMLKITHDGQQQDHQDIPFNLPLTVHMSDSDDMDVD